MVPTGYSFNLDGSTLYQEHRRHFLSRSHTVSTCRCGRNTGTGADADGDVERDGAVRFLRGVTGDAGQRGHIPLEGLASPVSTGILDMARTALNVVGMLAVLVIAKGTQV